jgi:hypothetical protein
MVRIRYDLGTFSHDLGGDLTKNRRICGNLSEKGIVDFPQKNFFSPPIKAIRFPYCIVYHPYPIALWTQPMSLCPFFYA